MKSNIDKFYKKVLLYYTQNPPEICKMCAFSTYINHQGDTMECQIPGDTFQSILSHRIGCEKHIFLKKLLEVI